MIDLPGRALPRFPAHKEAGAAVRICAVLDQLCAAPEDLALTQGACGGDILFTEACLARGVPVCWLQPFREPDFIRNSVLRGGEDWHRRYQLARAGLAGPIRSMPDELGDPSEDSPALSPYERCNLWLLDTALACGPDRVRFICLWDGGGGDGPGGTAHMLGEVQRRAGQVIWIDTRHL